VTDGGAMNGSAPIIRPSRDDDVAAITAIYGYHVLHGVASFEEVPPGEEEMRRRRGDIIGRGLGYCYAGPFRPRIGYRYTLEDSVYVAETEVGRGIGRALLQPVLDKSAVLGYRRMVAVIGGCETVASIRLHQSLGFAHVGVFEAVGFKFGRWIDTILMQRALGPGAATAPG
jgi:L-amino acid N-acyltransferase YncA